jgi:hypothetical protein
VIQGVLGHMVLVSRGEARFVEGSGSGGGDGGDGGGRGGRAFSVGGTAGTGPRDQLV